MHPPSFIKYNTTVKFPVSVYRYEGLTPYIYDRLLPSPKSQKLPVKDNSLELRLLLSINSTSASTKGTHSDSCEKKKDFKISYPGILIWCLLLYLLFWIHG